MRTGVLNHPFFTTWELMPPILFLYPIDWDRVNTIRRSEQQRAFDFLKKNLN